MALSISERAYLRPGSSVSASLSSGVISFSCSIASLLLSADCCHQCFQRIEFHVQRVACVATQDECDVFVEFSVSPAQRQDGNADDRNDELQPLHVVMQPDGQLLIDSKLSVRCWVCGISA